MKKSADERLLDAERLLQKTQARSVWSDRSLAALIETKQQLTERLIKLGEEFADKPDLLRELKESRFEYEKIVKANVGALQEAQASYAAVTISKERHLSSLKESDDKLCGAQKAHSDAERTSKGYGSSLLSCDSSLSSTRQSYSSSVHSQSVYSSNVSILAKNLERAQQNYTQISRNKEISSSNIAVETENIGIFQRGADNPPHLPKTIKYYDFVTVWSKGRTSFCGFNSYPEYSCHKEFQFNHERYNASNTAARASISHQCREKAAYHLQLKQANQQFLQEAEQGVLKHQQYIAQYAREKAAAAASLAQSTKNIAYYRQLIEQYTEQRQEIAKSLAKAQQDAWRCKQEADKYFAEANPHAQSLITIEQDIVRYQQLIQYYTIESLEASSKLQETKKATKDLESQIKQMLQEEKIITDQLDQIEEQIAISETLQIEALQDHESRAVERNEALVEKIAHDDEARLLSAAEESQDLFAFMAQDMTSTESVNSHAQSVSLIGD